ncbi:MAG: hypothetical protein JRG80_07430 [Deltaproteobacteria bacterium]|nr:hypothetical protein [Deltaproteobacteria bacterium]
MQRWWSVRSAIKLVAVLTAALPALTMSAAAGEGGEPTVGLDKLLRIPPTVQFEPTKRGHSTKTEWRDRFDEADSDLVRARAKLAETQAKLAEIGSTSSAWTMGAPGLSSVSRDKAVEAPLDQGLSVEMRNRRAEVERTERRRAELEVEANLANLPDDWRGTPKPQDEEAQALR